MLDVIVVGAGPAGSTAAYFCARGGLKTLLLEKDDVPRDKPCGGMLSPRYIERFGLNGLVEARADRCRLLVNHEDIGCREADACLVDRRRFDSALTRMAEGAGAELVTCKKVTGMTQDDEVVVECGADRYRSRLIIGADGVNSIVRRAGGLENYRVRPDRIVSLVSEVAMPRERIDHVLGNHGHTCFDINFSTFFPGYAWIFPKGDRLNIGIGAVAHRGKDLRSCLEGFMKGMGLGDIALTDLRGALIPCRPLDRVRNGRTLLVGDAAGLVDPFTGGGIDLGMRSGEMAAHACIDALRCGDLSLLGGYDRAIAPTLRTLRTKSRLVDLATKLMAMGLDSPTADRVVLKLFNRLA